MLKFIVRLCRQILPFSGLVACCGILLPSANAEPAFWIAEDDNSKVYLLGSMHFGRKDFYPLPSIIEKSYSRSEALVVEVDITKLDSAKTTETIRRYAAMPQSESLQSVLSKDTYANLKHFCAENGLNVETWSAWQPWFVALQLVQLEVAKSNLKAAFGVDYYFLNKRSKPIVELESMESQFAIFSGFSALEQEAFIDQTLKDLKQSNAYLNAMADLWVAGDVTGLEKLLIEPFAEGDLGQSFFEKLFTRRNRQMASHVAQFLTKDREVFVVVGAGHMVGDTGIVELLRQKGFTVHLATNAESNSKRSESILVQ